MKPRPSFGTTVQGASPAERPSAGRTSTAPTPPGQLRLAHALPDQLAFGVGTQARLHQPVEYAELRQVFPSQQQGADPRGFQVEIHHQHVASALGLVRGENRHGTGPSDTALML